MAHSATHTFEERYKQFESKRVADSFILAYNKNDATTLVKRKFLIRPKISV